MGMDMCCIYLGLILMRKYLDLGYLPFALILACYPLLFLINLTMMKWPNTAKQSTIVNASTGIIIVSAVAAVSIREILVNETLIGNPGGILGVGLQIGFCGLSWWLGYSLIRYEIDYQKMCFRFQIGILALIVLAMIEGLIFLPVIFYFVLAVLALALTRWEASVSISIGVLRAFQPGSFILGSMVVLLPATFIFLALSPDIARAILHLLWTTGGTLIDFLGLDRPPPSAGKPIAIGLSGCSCKPSKEKMIFSLPPSSQEGTSVQTSPIILWLLIFSIFLAVLFFIFLTVKKIKARRRADPTDMIEVETVSITTSLLRELTAFIKRIGKMVWHYLLFTLRLGYLPRFRSRREDELLLSARAIYRSFLHWAARHGLPRTLSQTPLEYLQFMCQRFPQQERELAIITDAFIQARYGRGAARSKVFEAAKKAWQKIRLEC